MSDKKTEQKAAEAPVNMTMEQMITFIKEIKRDDDVIAAKAQKEAEAKEMAETAADTRANLQRFRNSCDHKREWGGQLQWNVAWSPYADDIPRGVCQRCGDEFNPEHPKYREMLTNGSTKGFYLTYHR